MKTVCLLFTLLLVVDAAVIQGQVPRPAGLEEQIVAQGQRVGSGTYVEMYQHGVTVDPAFVQRMETVYKVEVHAIFHTSRGEQPCNVPI